MESEPGLRPLLLLLYEYYELQGRWSQAVARHNINGLTVAALRAVDLCAGIRRSRV